MPYKDPVKLAAYKLEHSRLPKSRESHRRYREEHPGYDRPSKRRSMLKKRYGITDADYATLLEKQSGRCAICGSLDPRGRGWFCVDHNHQTGQVRGLLCAPCNAALGVLERPKAWLDAAQAYLALHVEHDPKG